MKAADYVNKSVFTVTIGDIELGFSKISGIGGSAEYDTFTEGGGRVHILPKPKSQAGVLTFEKGISVVDTTTAKIFSPGNTLNGIIITLKNNNENARVYYIESAFVVSWQLSELDAVSSGVAIQTFQIAHTGII